MNDEFMGKAVPITGAGAGIGRAIGARLTAGGARVVLTDEHRRRLDEATKWIRSQHPKYEPISHMLDVEKWSDFARVLMRFILRPHRHRHRHRQLQQLLAGLHSDRLPHAG